MSNPTNLKYAKTHEWASIEGSVAKVGITQYAAKELGDIVYVNLPEVGSVVKCGTSFTDIESVKAVSEVLSPVCGKVISVNEALSDSPELINETPFEAWIIEVELTGEGELISSEQYSALTSK